jgi:hypothetical protein
MKRLNKLIGTLSAAALLTVGIASAASLGVTSGNLSAGTAAVTGCSSSPLTATRSVANSGFVTGVSVTNVPQACSGEKLAVTLEDTAHASLGTASATVGTCSGGCSVTLTGFGTVSATSLISYAFSLTQ